MFRKVLLAVALQNWDTPTPYARAAREVAIQLAKGSSNPLHVLTLSHYQPPAIEQNPFVGSQVLQEAEQMVKAEEEAVRAAVEVKLRQYVHDIESAGVAVVRLIRPGNPRDEVIRVPRKCALISSSSARTANAVCSTSGARPKRSANVRRSPW